MSSANRSRRWAIARIAIKTSLNLSQRRPTRCHNLRHCQREWVGYLPSPASYWRRANRLVARKSIGVQP
ncbi:MAG: hypothetical protein F6J93_40210 [Oscillatoria sp. SIO1A7]|nr:hypothetical protein [Oscillatoria sp. SIO1A7]